MPNTYLGVYCRLKNLPILFKDSKTILPGNKISYFAKGTKEYDISGEYITTPYKDAPQVKLVEEYFNKIKGFDWFSEKPFFLYWIAVSLAPVKSSAITNIFTVQLW